jgi:hypothetical protein
MGGEGATACKKPLTLPEVASPIERVGVRELKVGVGKLEGQLFDRTFVRLR